ncbi:putative bifunctional diguanylate cyclase/phosphodiesterase [Marinomonas polaris]|uniref:putative bifunctional diguanylate cyclase/phosphodiesterase n=1 Tax=Marinomonas polaris TaxID=293552 RepID=UPI003F9AB64B
MTALLELQRDKSFRLKLILICLTVALSVASIYTVVSYRLAADLGLKTALDSLHRQAMLIHGELLITNKKAPEEHLAELIKLVYFNDHLDASELYIKITGPNLEWSIDHKMNPIEIDLLLSKLMLLTSTSLSTVDMPNGQETMSGKQFLWQVVRGNKYQVIIIKTSEYIDNTLTFVMKRLIITSIIVFWLATWFALTLSSWMNKRVQDKNDSLAHLATHDSLTGLPNRLFLANMMHPIIIDHSDPTYKKYEEFYSHHPKQGCLFVIDLDKFKEVNDTFGHAAGDTLLIKVAKKLNQVLDATQTLVRFGGDKFIIWAPEVDIEQAKNLVQRLIITCNEPVMINKLAISTGASIGLSHYPSQATDPESLILYADTAMYEAKQNRSGWSMFSERNIQCGRQRLKLRADLDDALSERQIKLHYQPKVSLKDGHIIGVEALARWYHPTDGLLPPAHFIELIEQSGRVQEFGRYVIANAIEQLDLWHQQGLFTPIALNLSPYNLLDPSLLDFTLRLLKNHKIEANKLEIELIESATSVNIKYISQSLNNFKEAGIKLAIDDFGTGMSSLSYISNLNVNHIKIDRSFIDGIEQDIRKQAVVSSVIMLANSFECEVIAEGIENKSQSERLIEMGCLYGQGYYYAKPMTAENMQGMLQADAALPL